MTVPDADVDAEVARGRERYAGRREARPEYFDSERGRTYIRSTLRRSRVVEGLIDEWLAAHPDHPAAAAPRGRPERRARRRRAAANAAIDATDPGSSSSATTAATAHILDHDHSHGRAGSAG